MSTDSDQIKYAVTIERSREDLYQYWRNFENLPNFSPHLKSVKTLDGNRTEWTTDGPTGPVSWIAEMTVDKPNETIGWNSIEGSDIETHGVVQFADAPGGRGTEVSVFMKVKTPWGALGKMVAKATGKEPEQEVEEMMRRFKALMETNEIPVVEVQPSR